MSGEASKIITTPIPGSPHSFNMVIGPKGNGFRGVLWHTGRLVRGTGPGTNKASEASGTRAEVEHALMVAAAEINAAAGNSLADRHRARFAGYPDYLGLRTASRWREVKCFGCGMSLNTSLEECISCRWIVCPSCISCGCNWIGPRR